jgi:hypothetical protein
VKTLMVGLAVGILVRYLNNGAPIPVMAAELRAASTNAPSRESESKVLHRQSAIDQLLQRINADLEMFASANCCVTFRSLAAVLTPSGHHWLIRHEQ